MSHVEEVGPGRRRDVRGRLTRPARVSFLLRGAGVWVAIHIGAAFTRAYAGPAGLGALQVGFVLVVVYLAVLVDQRVRREHLLLGNAGIPPWVGPAHAVAAAATLETLVQVLARAVGVGAGG